MSSLQICTAAGQAIVGVAVDGCLHIRGEQIEETKGVITASVQCDSSGDLQFAAAALLSKHVVVYRCKNGDGHASWKRVAKQYVLILRRRAGRFTPAIRICR